MACTLACAENTARIAGVLAMVSASDIKKALLFLKKKKQKNFCSCGVWRRQSQSPP
jgi:hypothetical protein